MNYTLKFEREKETKNTVRFQEVVPDGSSQVIGPLYIQKSAIGEKAPQLLVVTVSARDADGNSISMAETGAWGTGR